MRGRVAVCAGVVAMLASWWWLPAVAQDAGEASAPARSAAETVAPAEIPVRADADERFAQEVIQRSQGQDPTARFGSRLDRLGDAVRSGARHLAPADLRPLSVTRLESLERHWRFYGRQLEGWRRDLQQSMAPYTEDAAELARRRAAWEATRAAAESGGMASALDHRIDAVLVQITLAEQAVSAPIDRQTRLSRRANAVERRIVAGQKAATAAIADIDSRLMQVDAPPLWQAWTGPRAAGGALQAVMTGMAAEKRFLDEYNASTVEFHRRMTVLALLLLPLLVWLSVRSRKVLSDDPQIQASARVLRRPLSSWLVLVMMGVLFLEPDAPILQQQVALLVMLVPVLRLLPPAVYQVLGPWPYIATGLYLLKQLSFLLLHDPFGLRIYLLGLTLLTAALLAWLYWRSRPRADAAPLSRGRRAVRFACLLAVVALLCSLVANVAGNVSLAEMLTSGILEAGYVGLVLYAGVTVLASVLRLLLARRVLSRFSVVKQHVGPLLHGFTRLLRVAAVVVWVLVVLNSFRIYRPIFDAVTGVLTYEIGFGELSVTLGGVLLFGFSVWLAFWAAKTVRLILQDEVLPRMALPRGVGSSISSLTYYALLMVGLFVALAAAGFEVSQLAIVVGALGVGIGFGLQNVVNNFVSGLILMFERPIQPGDVVEVSGTSGRVREIGMRATTLSTFEGAEVVVPNGVLLNEKLVNWTLSDTDRRIDVDVGVAYGTDPRRVLDLLLEVTTSTDGVASEPAPSVLFAGFGASSLNFAIRAWTNNFGDWVKIRSELNVRVYDALRAAGIEIPFPQQDLHLRSVAPAAGAALAVPGPAAEPRAGG